MTEAEVIRLGLIGDNIAASRSPLLHRLAGSQNGRIVTYDRLVPHELGLTFREIFERSREEGYHGLNITYPYKEVVTALVEVEDPLVRAIGAVNTVVFGKDRPRGFNTDHSGFIAAYRGVRGERTPGITCLIGAGGVGRAVAFGLAALGAEEIRLADRDPGKAEALAKELMAARPGLVAVAGSDAGALSVGAAGLVNCTPVGMVGHAGIPVPAEVVAAAEWVFDAVYTPVDTQFLLAARAAGVTAISGYELFIWQGVDAWAIFTGLPLDVARLRASLLEPEGA